MNREEAIRQLNAWAMRGDTVPVVAIHMAIEALQAQTDGDKVAIECETCKHKLEPWDSEPCDGCTKAKSNYEPEKQVTGKLNKCDDSLLTDDSDVCKEHKSKLDLISRRDAVSEIHKYFVEEIDKTPTEIDEDGDELYTDMPTVNSLLACNKELSKRIKSLPSAEVPTVSEKHQLSKETPTNTPTDLISRQEAIDTINALHEKPNAWLDSAVDAMMTLPSATCDDCIWHVCNYNKVDWDGEDGYISKRDAIDEIKALYEWHDTVTEDRAVDHLKRLPTAKPKTGKWVRRIAGTDYWHCSECGDYGLRTDFCPNCGADMKGKEHE